MSLAEKIADFACNTIYEDLSPESIHEAKRRLIDTLGCAMGSWLSDPVKIARRLAMLCSSDFGGRVVGTGYRATPDMAAFANGVMFRYLDYNDTYLSKEPAHPSDNFAAVLAVADAFDLGGKDVILGAIIAYEVQCRLCDAYSIRKRGWDHVTYGAFSTVAGCGAMLGFDAETMVHALGLAGVPNNAMRQTRVGELSMWKGCAFANASRNGVFATILANMGMTGASQVFEGEMGFFNEICGGDTFDIEKFGGNGEPYMINRTYIKKYPAEYHSQSAVDAAEQIVKEHGGVFSPESIDSIEIATFNASYEIIGGEPEKWRPESRETADHSLPYITCAALVDGKVTIATYDESRFRDETLLGVVAKTKVVPDPELDKVYPEGGIPNRLTVKLKDGRTFDKRVDAPSGHALNPMTDEMVEDKFLTMAVPMLGREAAVERSIASLGAGRAGGTYALVSRVHGLMTLRAKFEELKTKGEKALVLFVTAGDPPLSDLPAVLETLREGGADVIELGIPFSDPIADGPTIQASSQRALDSGVTPLSALAALAKSNLDIPVVLMGYYNPVLRRGLERFASDIRSAGASGTIISDLTPEEAGPWIAASKSEGLDTIFLAAPTSTDARLDEVCRRSTGFVYAVSRTGVTGALSKASDEAAELVQRLKTRTELPVCIGFGISQPEHVRAICDVADGAVIGSWLVDLLHEEWDSGQGRSGIVAKLRAMKAETVGRHEM